MPIGKPNLFGLTQYDNKTSFFQDGAPLSQGLGYPLVIGIAAAFVLFTIGLFWLDRRYAGTEYDSEHFQTAGRRVKTGLISVDIVSHWCWSSTILQSSNQAFIYGIAGPYWFSGAAVVQILCFGIIAVYIKVFFYFLMVTSIIVAGQLILGGSAVIHALTGMNIYAAIFLIPFSVVLYTMTGGLKSTFVSSYVHTVIIYAVLLTFCFTVYTVSDLIGSPGEMYDRMVKYAEVVPVSGNRGGSYLTMWSLQGIKFGILQVVSCWGITVADQAYWQSAIAARPSAAWKGLVPPAAAVAVLGKTGAILIVIIILMAITSSGSAEMVAVSSLVTYDFYRPWFSPKAGGKELLVVSRIMVVIYGLVMAIVSVAFNLARINLNFLYFFMATATTSAVPPMVGAIAWKKCSRVAALVGGILGQILGLTAWVVEAHIQYGVVDTTTLQQVEPSLAGGCFSLCGSTILTVGLSLWFPQNFDWNDMKSIAVYNDVSKDKEDISEEESPKNLLRIEKLIWIWAGGLTFVFIFAWPLLTLPAGIFSKPYFHFWVILALIWALVASVLAAILPILESREVVIKVLGKLVPGLGSLEQDAARQETKEAQLSPAPAFTQSPYEVSKLDGALSNGKAGTG